jgi:arginyl-tRNA synthetase
MLLKITRLFQQSLAQVAPDQPHNLVLEKPRQAEHGDYACTVALQLAKALKLPPRQIAQAIVDNLPASPLIKKVELAGAGFINVFLSAQARQGVVHQVLEQGAAYGNLELGSNQPIQVEFVSSNPTGPLHVGHGRGAAFGASLANILHKAGYRVHREYYVNDAGRQMDILAVSTWLRYLGLLGSKIPFPPNGYQGDYVTEMARALELKVGRAWHQSDQELLSGCPGEALGEDESSARQNEEHMDQLIANAKALLGSQYKALLAHALKDQLADCRDDLQAFGVVFDEWFSEQSLFDSGAVEQLVNRLKELGHLYEQDGALWFRSSHFGDEKDRVVQRDNGIYTYFASDIAYHVGKFERGFTRIIDVWGADHHGYIPRVRAALTALGYDVARLEVPLVQFVSLYRNGEKAQMSTRKGQYVTLRELRGEVGNDAARFFYVLRKSDQHLDFDLDLAKSQSNDNPVYYVQYAHARIHSVLGKWGGERATLAGVDLAPLTDPQEAALMQSLRDYPDLIESAARDYAPHQLAFYLKDVAAQLHSYYNAQQFLVEDMALRQARLALIVAVSVVLKDGLSLLGVSAPETM